MKQTLSEMLMAVFDMHVKCRISVQGMMDRKTDEAIVNHAKELRMHASKMLAAANLVIISLEKEQRDDVKRAASKSTQGL